MECKRRAIRDEVRNLSISIEQPRAAFNDRAIAPEGFPKLPGNFFWDFAARGPIRVIAAGEFALVKTSRSAPAGVAAVQVMLPSGERLRPDELHRRGARDRRIRCDSHWRSFAQAARHVPK
jgi:hypothetical protein